MKRFYKIVSTRAVENGYHILLDSRNVKTPSKNDLLAPTQALADALMQEWAAQEDEIKPDSMPLTQIISTKIDRVSTERTAMQGMLMRYLNTDLVCYFADHPPELIERQKQHWQPALDFFAEKFGIRLETTSGLSALTQPEDAHSAVQTYIENMDAENFTALQLITPACGSLVLALAMVEGKTSAQDIFNAARVEEHFKAEIYDEEKYGPDPAQEKKDRALQADLEATEKFLSLLK